MTIKNYLFVILAILALTFAGCSSTDGQQSGFGIGGGSSNSNTQSSSDGVNLEFQQLSYSPQKDNEFSLVLNVKNNLLQDVDVKIKPTGFDWNYVTQGLDKEFSIPIAKATANGPNQNAHYIEGIKLSGFTGDYNWNPTFKYCYQAKSQFREQVCIPNKLNNCDADVSSDTFTNGLLTTSISSIYPISSDKVGLEFTVKNSKNGFVVNECFQDENKNDFGNKVSTPIVKLGTQTGVCSPTSTSNGYVINQNSLQFKCEFDRSGDPSESYASQVSVEFDYLYSQSVKNKITIVDLENRNN